MILEEQVLQSISCLDALTYCISLPVRTLVYIKLNIPAYILPTISLNWYLWAYKHFCQQTMLLEYSEKELPN